MSALRLDHPGFVELYAYWDDKRAGRWAPARKDIDPVEIPHLLPNMFIYEVTRDPLDYRMVLFGTSLAILFGADLTNRTFDEIFSGPSAANIRRDYDQVVESREPLVTFHSAQWIDRDFVSYQRLVLPLSDDGKDVTKLIGAAYPKDE